MRQRAVDAAVGEQPEEVQPPARLPRRGEDVRDFRALCHGSVVDGVVDARDVHHRDATGTEVQVADFAVAHLPRRQPDVGAAGLDDVVGKRSKRASSTGVLARRTALLRLFGALAENRRE